MSLISRFKNSWNAFKERDPTNAFQYPEDYGISGGSYRNPSLLFYTRGNARSITNCLYNQIAVDCSSLDIKHVRLDDDDQFKEVIDDSLNWILTRSANIDQTGRSLIRNAICTMLEEGHVVFVPIDTDVDPNEEEAFKIYTMRIGKVTEWFPQSVRVEVYNDRSGNIEEVMMLKRAVAIVENPFYRIMNEPNSTAQRLMKVTKQIDTLNDSVVTNKLDLIIQLPYTLRDTTKRVQAERRRRDLEKQLTTSQLGVGYIDATEKVIQLNRSLENNLWEQAKTLQDELFSQLGYTKSIFDGTADEQTMLNYQNRTVEPILTSIVEAMDRSFLSRTAISQKQAIRFFKSPFKLVPVAKMAELSDKFTRNEIMTSNEIRSSIGLKPSDDPKANELRNSNLNHPDEEGTTSTVIDEVVKEN